MKKLIPILAVVVVVAFVAYFFLRDPVTASNYERIQTGMAMSEVEGILGKGTEKTGISGGIGDLTGSGSVVTWGDDEKSITITFANDKVITKMQEGL